MFPEFDYEYLVINKGLLYSNGIKIDPKKNEN